mgnify:FL=1
MDDADRAQEAMEVLDAARSRTVHAAEAEATGFCLWCDARMAPNQRWCDAACRDDWRRAKDAEVRNGRSDEP